MATLTAVKSYISTDKLAQKFYDFHSDGFKVALLTSAVAPTQSMTTWTTSSALGSSTVEATSSGSTGYTADGVALTCTTIGSNSGSGTTLKTSANFASPTWTAANAGFSFRYAVLWDTTIGSGTSGNYIAYWDTTAITLSGANGDTYDLSGSAWNTSWGTVS